MILQELQQAMQAALRARDMFDSETHNLCQQAEEAIWSNRKAQHDHLKRAAQQARDAYLAEKERIALTGEGLPFPIGTKVRNKNHSKLVGLVEVRTRTTPFPNNAANYSMPEVGEAFVRLLKADGKPGSKFEKFYTWMEWEAVSE